MATAGTVTIKLDGDSATLIRELSKANEAANSTFTSIGQQAADLALKFAGIATAAGVAFAALAKRSFEANDALAKQADRLGITTQSLRTMQVAADLAGVAQETLVKSIQKQQKALVEAADGSATAAATFRNLGLSVDELLRLPADQQFATIAAALNNVDNVARRNALAMQIWGDRAAEMINFAAEAGEGVDDLAVTLTNLNATMSRFDAAKIEQANDAVSVAKLAFEGLGNTIAVAVAPYVTALAEDFTEAAESAGGFKTQVADALEFVATAAGFAGNAILGLKIVFKEVAAAFLDVGGDIAALMGFLFDSDAAREVAANAKGAAVAIEDEIRAAFNSPLPSDAIDKWFADAKAKADVAAREITEKMSGKQAVGGGGGGDQAKRDAEELKRWLDQMKADAEMNKAIAPKVIIPEIKPGDFLPDPEVTRQFTEMSTQQYLAQWQLANEQRAAAEQVLRDTLYQSNEQAGQALIALAAQQAREKVQAEFQARGEAMGEDGQFLDPRAQAEFEQQVRSETLLNEQIYLQQRLQMQQAFGQKYMAMQALIANLVGKSWADGHKKSLTVAASFATAAMSIAQSLFGEHKGFAIAMAIINTLTGVTQALASVPYPANLAAAASVAASGFAQVQQIRSTSVGSGSVGSVGGFGGGAMSSTTSLGGFQGDGTDKAENKQVTVQFNGPLYGMDKYVQEQLVGAIRDAVDGKDIVLFGGQSRQAQIIRGSG